MQGVIGTLSALKSLRLDSNGLTKLPNTIGDMHNLERLSLEFNQLLFLPPTTPNLTSLTVLDCSKNSLRALPLKIGHLESLQELHCNDNQLYLLPDSIGMCSNLHTLALSNNFISVIPSSICFLSNLTQLSVNNNSIKVIPPVMSQNELLISFDFANNPILDPPQLVLSKGFEAVMMYLKKMFDVTFTGHLDLRDLQLPDLPADLLGAMGGGDQDDSKKNGKEEGSANLQIKLGAPLKQLSLTGNRIKYLPTFVGELSALKALIMDDVSMCECVFMHDL